MWLSVTNSPIFHLIIVLPRDAMLARYMLSSCVCPSVRVSVTSRHCTKMAKRRITQITPDDSLGNGILVFWCQRSRRNSNSVTPKEGAKQMWDRFRSAIFDQYLAISRKRCKIGTWLLGNANRNSYALYRMALFSVTLSDLNYPEPPHFDILYRLSYLRSGWR